MISLKKRKRIYDSVSTIGVVLTSFNENLPEHTIEDYVRRYKQYLGRNSDNSNILVIPDLHAPFIRDGYLEFCVAMKKKWNCKRVIFLGDLIDNHYSSYHETDPDGYSAIEELNKAIDQIQDFYKEFPYALVMIGNHDAIPDRKAFTSGVSSKWVKSIDEVLKVPNWEFKQGHREGNTYFCHGMKKKAKQRMMDDMTNVVQGHYHSESYIYYNVGADRKTFAMQLGCGIDNNKYAMAYARDFSRQHINLGILVGGTVPVLEYMEL